MTALLTRKLRRLDCRGPTQLVPDVHLCQSREKPQRHGQLHKLVVVYHKPLQRLQPCDSVWYHSDCVTGQEEGL